MLARIELFVYECATFLVSLPVGLLFVFHPRGRRRIAERFGIWESVAGPYVWFHAASVGEVGGLAPVLERVKQQFPQYKLLLTCTSPTGLDRGAALVDEVRLLPFDCRCWLLLACRGRFPKALVISETEIWPGLFGLMQRNAVPLLMINARLSERSMRGYKFCRWFIRPQLEKLSLLGVSSSESYERFVALGVERGAMQLWGNSKYDRAPQLSTEDTATASQAFFQASSKLQVLVLGSLRPQEENVWFPALQQALPQNPQLRVVLAPRHQENFEYFAQALASAGFAYARWSRGQAASQQPVLLLDAMGILERAYAGASLAFVGATLVPIGGHNPLEPAAYAVPVCVGPHCGTIAEVVEQLEQADAIVRITTSADALALLQRIGTSELQALGQRGQEVWRQNRGASERIVAGVGRYL